MTLSHFISCLEYPNNIWVMLLNQNIFNSYASYMSEQNCLANFLLNVLQLKITIIIIRHTIMQFQYDLWLSILKYVVTILTAILICKMDPALFFPFLSQKKQKIVIQISFAYLCLVFFSI